MNEMDSVCSFDSVPDALGELTKFIGGQGALFGFVFGVAEQLAVVKLAT